MNQHNVFIINGNHEDEWVYGTESWEFEQIAGLGIEFDEEITKFLDNNPGLINIKNNIINILNILPSCIFIHGILEDKWVQLCHGGIDINSINKLKQILSTRKGIQHDEKVASYILERGDSEEHINRYQTCGFKWSDFLIIDESRTPHSRTFWRCYNKIFKLRKT